MSSRLESRQAEIQAKRAKLNELKKQRELRAKELSTNRQSLGGDGAEVHELPFPSNETSGLIFAIDYNSIAGAGSTDAVEGRY